jgi:hypothetical protein
VSEQHSLITCTPRLSTRSSTAGLRSLLALSRKPGSCRSRRVYHPFFVSSFLLVSRTPRDASSSPDRACRSPPPTPVQTPVRLLVEAPADTRVDRRPGGRKHGANLFGLTCASGHHEHQPHGCRASSVCSDSSPTTYKPTSTFGRLSLGFRGGP